MIQTRQNHKGNWWCNGTINGSDVSFEGATIEDARQQMVDYLNRRGITSAQFSEPVYYPHEEKLPKDNWRPIRLDYLKRTHP